MIAKTFFALTFAGLASVSQAATVGFSNATDASSPLGSVTSALAPPPFAPTAPSTDNATDPGAGGSAATTYTTVVTAFTTYCPSPTNLTFNSKTYVVTSATTLTITDCPCTLTHTAGAGRAPKASGSAPVNANGTVVGTPSAPLTPSVNGTAPGGAGSGPKTITTVVTALTTYCPAPTTFTVNSKTYTVTKPTTLVITDCPCTISSTVTGGGEAASAPSVAPGSESTAAQSVHSGNGAAMVAPAGIVAAIAGLLLL